MHSMCQMKQKEHHQVNYSRKYHYDRREEAFLKSHLTMMGPLLFGQKQRMNFYEPGLDIAPHSTIFYNILINLFF